MATFDVNLSVLATEYVQVPIFASSNGTLIDPTSDEVRFAFVTSGTPVEADWVLGSWETTAGGYLAQVLVGPDLGGTPLQLGSYNMWIQIIDTSEKPVRQVGRLKIT